MLVGEPETSGFGEPRKILKCGHVLNRKALLDLFNIYIFKSLQVLGLFRFSTQGIEVWVIISVDFEMSPVMRIT